MATANPETIPFQPSISFDWFGVLTRYGFTTFLACATLGYLAFYVVEPMRKDQQLFMQSVIETNKLNASTVAKQTEIQQQQAQALKDIVPVLQQIRDDQRRGAWLDNNKKSSGT